MEIMLDTVKHIAIFILLFSFVKHLYLGSSYEKYFSYLEGVLLVVLLLTPIISYISGKQMDFDLMEKNSAIDKDLEKKIEEVETIKWSLFQEEEEHEQGN